MYSVILYCQLSADDIILTELNRKKSSLDENMFTTKSQFKIKNIK